MKTRLLLSAVCVLTLPILFSPSKGDTLTKSVPFATVALAGHTLGGNYCQCGCPECICDPGETIDSCGRAPRPASAIVPVEDSGKIKTGRGRNLDLGTIVFLISLALLMWSRMRG